MKRRLQAARERQQGLTLEQAVEKRCNACGEVFTAAAPERAGADKYDETAVASVALLKYGTGVPFQRLERLPAQLGMPLPAATQGELMEAAAKLLRAVLVELIRLAAQGSVLHNDDTGVTGRLVDVRAMVEQPDGGSRERQSRGDVQEGPVLVEEPQVGQVRMAIQKGKDEVLVAGFLEK